MLTSALLGFLALSGPAASAAQPRPLNVVVLDICSARADRFGSQDGKPSLTPGIDRFASESTSFTKAWAQSSWCLPNYATLLTGHRPEVHGLYANIPFRGLPAWEETMAERLRRTGYRTGGFTSGVYTLPAWGLDKGFDTYVNRFSTEEAKPGRFQDIAGDISAWMTRSSTQPFFLYATVDDMHAPYQSDESTAVFAGPAIDTETLNVRFFRAYNGEATDPRLALKAAAFKKDPQALTGVVDRYDAAVRSTDRAIARFIDGLKKQGLWENTVLVVTADHGELLGEHGLLGHTEGLYEPILHVPMYIHHPAYPASAGKRVDALVERQDLTPTLMESAGADITGLELQGRSLTPLLENPGLKWRRYAYASSKRNLADPGDWLIDERAVRDDRWKLMWSSYKNRWELFDLEKDPQEKHDLSSARLDVVSRLAFELESQTEAARTHAAGRPSGATPTDAPRIEIPRSQ